MLQFTKSVLHHAYSFMDQLQFLMWFLKIIHKGALTTLRPHFFICKTMILSLKGNYISKSYDD